MEREAVTPELLRAAGQASTGTVTVGPAVVNNIRLVAFNAARDEEDPTKLLGFARVLNFRKDPARVKVDPEVQVPGQTLGVFGRNLEFPARQLTIAKMSDPPP